MTLAGLAGRTEGIIVLEVDDMLEFGEKAHHDNMKRHETELRFGKNVDLMKDHDGVMFADA